MIRQLFSNLIKSATVFEIPIVAFLILTHCRYAQFLKDVKEYFESVLRHKLGYHSLIELLQNLLTRLQKPIFRINQF